MNVLIAVVSALWVSFHPDAALEPVVPGRILPYQTCAEVEWRPCGNLAVFTEQDGYCLPPRSLPRYCVVERARPISSVRRLHITQVDFGHRIRSSVVDNSATRSYAGIGILGSASSRWLREARYVCRA